MLGALVFLVCFPKQSVVISFNAQQYFCIKVKENILAAVTFVTVMKYLKKCFQGKTSS
jgi:hypothetical protein